jgi:hypothetical protein
MRRRQSFGFKGQLEMADHVFADSLCLAFGLSLDLAVDVETCMSPAENLLDQGKLFPHPLAPHLKPLRMTRWAESACLAGKHEEAFLPTVWAPDAGKPTLRVTTVEILVHNLLDNGSKVAILSLKSALIFLKESIEVMKKHSIENSPF